MANLLKDKRGKKERAKSRMLNIEEFAGGLMKLTMQVNSLLQVPVPHPSPPPPPPSPPPLPCFVPHPHWLIARKASGLCVSGVAKCICVCVCVCTLTGTRACMEGLQGVIQGQKPQY